MDWAEELKMSIRKTTARKGRRSKSRDPLKDTTGGSSGNTTATTTTVTSPNVEQTTTGNKDISIDITLDMQQSGGGGGATATSSTTTPTNMTGTSYDSDARPPQVRRISGGWADGGGLKSGKAKKGSFDDDRFQFGKLRSSLHSPPDDNIPVIPDLDDIKDDILMNEIAEPPSVAVNRVVTLKELDSDLLAQNAFSAVEDVDLSILTRCLQPQETLDEADEVWEWDKLFTDVLAEIHSEKPRTADAAPKTGEQAPPMLA